MSKEFENENESAAPEASTDLVAMIRKMQQQLNSLDKKIEILLSRPKENTFRDRHFSPHGRSFGRPSFHGRDSRHSSDRREYHHGNRGSFEDRGPFRPREEGEGHYSGKKHYGDSSHGGEPRGFVHKKKPFFLKRKERE